MMGYRVGLPVGQQSQGVLILSLLKLQGSTVLTKQDFASHSTSERVSPILTKPLIIFFPPPFLLGGYL